MPRIFNLNKFKERRKKLRNQMTPCERILWSKLKSRQLAGYKFRRQYGIDRYIVDFYCPKLKLAIEVDGGIHALRENKERDESRQEYIESFGIRVKRFTNTEIRNELDAVMNDLYNFVKACETDMVE